MFLVLNVAKNHRDIVFAVADEDEQVELVKKFNLQDSGEDVNVGRRDKEWGFYLKVLGWNRGKIFLCKIEPLL